FCSLRLQLLFFTVPAFVPQGLCCGGRSTRVRRPPHASDDGRRTHVPRPPYDAQNGVKACTIRGNRVHNPWKMSNFVRTGEGLNKKVDDNEVTQSPAVRNIKIFNI
ncbi:MAG: hypothetical protein ACFNT8_03960, partial [Prevotella sp.]